MTEQWRRATLAVVAGLAAVAPACSYSTGAEESAEPVRAGDNDRRVSIEEPETSPPSGPTSTLPDPGVASGACRVVVYTPPSAIEPHEGELCRPASEGASDAGIVLVHGGGGIAGNRTGVSGWASTYTAAGYTTLAVDYHLFDPGAESPVFPLPEQNIKAAVQYLRGSAPSLGIDPEHIVLQGHSAGARVGAVAYTTAGDPLFDGPELWPGIDDHVNAFIGFYSTYDGSHQYDVQYYGGARDDTDPAVRRAWSTADALTRTDAVRGPAAFFTGALDWTELATQQEQFADGVKAAGHQAFTFVADGGEHGYDSSPTGLTEGGLVAAGFLVGWLDGMYAAE